MKVNEFLQEIENVYNRHFPDSKCFTKLSTNLYANIKVDCFLAGSQKELSNGYWENDMLNISFSIDTTEGAFDRDITTDSTLSDNLVLNIIAKNYLTKPESNHYAYGNKPLTFRKTKGNVEKLLKTLDRYFAKLKEELKKDVAEDKVHDKYKNLLLEKLG